MTLEDGEQTQQHRTDNSQMDIAEALSHVLGKANEEDRLTKGIYECATLLGKDPESVFLCLLTDNCTGDVALHMHFTLMKAYCWENEIRLMLIEDYENLVKLLSNNNSATGAAALDNGEATVDNVEDTVDNAEAPMDNTQATVEKEGIEQITSDATKLCCLIVQYPSAAEKDVAMDTVLQHYTTMLNVTPYPAVTLGK
ncbi:growth arrest and DNA-damage-inducible, alpha-like [Saccoglossus kowalevskii]|uniref:Gadd45-like protein n=1 Tax=Saccoglossus kowalevskii TaxID=10224 RepID=B5THN6_SACKO|nr:growth arrest and DNA-damage-inducible, alpha-like [Saccoglossus kowalevskii]ACH73244.1 gadd45-like protein [Saccoglossus kowalevskii]